MISPFTPPGTKIVCVNVTLRIFTIGTGHGDLDGLKLGEVYTAVRIVAAPRGVCGFTVVLREIDRPDCFFEEDRGFSIGRFRRAELPRCLTSILTGSPIREREDA